MGSAADTAEANIAKALVQNTSFAFGATLYWGLATACADGSYTEVPNANGYARVAMTANATNMPVTGSTFSNGIVVTWPTATGSWGTPGFVFVANSATWGSAQSTIGFWDAITTPQAIGSGQTASFSIGSSSWSVD